MRRAAIFLIALLLAGCSEPVAQEVQDADGTDAPQNDDLGEDDGIGVNATNVPPLANLTASVLAGPAPLEVNFTLDGADADGDNLTWTFSINGEQIQNGTELPSEVVHLFDVGNHTVDLTVHDGQSRNTTTLTIEVVEAAPAFDPITHSTTIKVPCPDCYFTGSLDQCAGFQAGMQDVDCGWFALPPEAEGRPYTTTSSGDDADIAFYSSCSPGNQVEFVGQTGHDEGNVPAGAGCVVMTDWLLPGTISITIT